MSGSRLDQIVKGAPPPGTSVPAVTSRSPSPVPSLDGENARRSTPSVPSQLSDPLSTLPSSPPQIYLNLLILEASLRSQYLTLRARRRQHIFFLLLLAVWNTCFFYALFLRPREDGSGVGGSVYWVIEMAEKVALMGGVLTGILIWGTGQWERGVRWPRRWLGVANRGLRTMNTKIIIVKGPWWREMLGYLSFLFPYSAFFPQHELSHRYAGLSTERRLHHTSRYGPDEEVELWEEDLAPGGDYIKLLLLPKPFSPDFRENWELYRTEYWEKENERRAHLLQRARKLERQTAKEQGGWLWWTGWRGWRRAKGTGEKIIDGQKHHRQQPDRDAKHLYTGFKPETHSRTSSRSSTPSNVDGEDRPVSVRLRRGSSSGSLNEQRRRGKGSAAKGTRQVSRLTPADSRPGTPPSATSRSTLARSSSSISISSGNESDRSQAVL
ncbi:hypothetical protein MMC20_001645 [Loxospora ochrophaea]|nr:hypothetical protein [Loxospora ochrophaea]